MMNLLSRNRLESILVVSFTIGAILIILPCEYKGEEENRDGTIITTAATRKTPVPIIFNSIPPSTFHAFVLSLIFAFTFSLSALLIHDSSNNSTRNKRNNSHHHLVTTRFLGWSSLASITFALAILFEALLLNVTSSASSSPPPLPPTSSSLLLNRRSCQGTGPFSNSSRLGSVMARLSSIRLPSYPNPAVAAPENFNRAFKDLFNSTSFIN